MRVNTDRLWDSLMQMAEIGATGDGGCNRQALTDMDIEGRRLFARWCAEIAITTRYDAVGNMFARMEGDDGGLAPFVIGSHLDTQPTGGRFDGVLGVLAGLEVLRRLREEDIKPPRPIEIACWMNEEGARFAPAMMGSGVWAGSLELNEVRKVQDQDGVSLGDELDRHGFSSFSTPVQKPMHAYLELHIEQGPVLEASQKEIGVVTGAQGIRWYDLEIVGDETHAGPTPMEMRNDPVWTLSDVLKKIHKIGRRDPSARATVGQIQTFPQSRNVVPGRIEISVDLRHPDEAILAEMHGELTLAVINLQNCTLRQIWHSPVVEFDHGLVSTVRNSAVKMQLSQRDIVSGAGHDALMVARKIPTAMIFVPCRGGVSHNPAEHIEPEQATAGANVLLNASLAYMGMVRDGR